MFPGIKLGFLLKYMMRNFPCKKCASHSKRPPEWHSNMIFVLLAGLSGKAALEAPSSISSLSALN